MRHAVTGGKQGNVECGYQMAGEVAHSPADVVLVYTTTQGRKEGGK